MWQADQVGRITPDGVITLFPTISANSEPEGIAVGADGNIWFTKRAGARSAASPPTE